LFEGDVEPTDAIDCSGNHDFGQRLFPDIPGNCNSLATVSLDLRHEGVELVLPSGGRDDFGAFSCEQLCGRVTDAGTGSGDDGDLAIQYCHV
jgi:hypothetical protein